MTLQRLKKSTLDSWFTDKAYSSRFAPTQMGALSPQADTARPAVFNPNERIFLACDRYKPKMPKCVIKQFQLSGDLDAQELAIAQNLFQREVEVTEVLTEVLKILQFVHDNNTIHRDIKPSNIMRNKQGLLYLLDFGAVKQIAFIPALRGGLVLESIFIIAAISVASAIAVTAFFRLLYQLLSRFL